MEVGRIAQNAKGLYTVRESRNGRLLVQYMGSGEKAVLREDLAEEISNRLGDPLEEFVHDLEAAWYNIHLEASPDHLDAAIEDYQELTGIELIHGKHVNLTVNKYSYSYHLVFDRNVQVPPWVKTTNGGPRQKSKQATNNDLCRELIRRGLRIGFYNGKKKAASNGGGDPRDGSQAQAVPAEGAAA